MPVNDSEPRYQLVDTNGNVVGTLYGKGDGSVAIQDSTGTETEFTDSGVDTPAVSTDQRSITNVGTSVTLGGGTNQTISHATFTKIEFDTEEFDHFGEWDTTNYDFTPHTTGVYLFACNLEYTNLSTGEDNVFIRLLEGGTEVKRTFKVAPGGASGINFLVAFAATSGTAYHFEGYQNSGSSAEIDADTAKSHAQIIQLA